MSANFQVLLVEDDDPLRQRLSELLSAEGWQVRATPSGQEAIELARRYRIDFSLLDMHLPGITGLEVIQTICREVRLVPSIMMSGQASDLETKQALAEQAVFRFLQKPLDLDYLRGSMQMLIRHHFGPDTGNA